MAAVAAIEGFRIFTDQRAFNFKNLLIMPKLLPISPHLFGTASATSAGAVAVALKSATAASVSETNLNSRFHEAATKSKKAESKDESLRCVMYLSCWAPN